jgi:hypothetical protein
VSARAKAEAVERLDEMANAEGCPFTPWWSKPSGTRRRDPILCEDSAEVGSLNMGASRSSEEVCVARTSVQAGRGAPGRTRAGSRSWDHEDVGRRDQADVIPQELRRVCDGGRRWRIKYFATVACRFRVSAIRRGSAARPTAGSPAPSCESECGCLTARSVAPRGAGSSRPTTAGSPVGARR